MKTMLDLSLERKFTKLQKLLVEHKERLLEVKPSKRSMKQKRKLSFIEQAIRNCDKQKVDHNLIRKIINL